MKKTYTLIFVLFLLWFSGFIVFAWHINSFSPNFDQQTDAIIALTGGRNRIIEAVNLLEQGLAKRLFISGVGKDISLSDIQKQQRIATTRLQQIDIGHNASDTIGNALETKLWTTQNNITSIRLVTSNYHIARSMVEFKKHNPSLIIIPHPVYSERIEKKWWTSWQTFSLIFKEYNKFVCAYIKNNL